MLPKPIDIVGKVLPELVANRADTNSVHSIDNSVHQWPEMIILVSGAIESLKSGIPHWYTYRYFTHSS